MRVIYIYNAIEPLLSRQVPVEGLRSQRPDYYRNFDDTFQILDAWKGR